MTKRDSHKTVYLLAAHLEPLEEAKEMECFAHLDVQLLFPKELPVPDDALVLIVPLDHLCLDARSRAQFLDQLPTLAPTVPTAAYGHDFDDEQPSTQNGVAVARKLNAALLGALLGNTGTKRRAA